MSEHIEDLIGYELRVELENKEHSIERKGKGLYVSLRHGGMTLLKVLIGLCETSNLLFYFTKPSAKTVQSTLPFQIYIFDPNNYDPENE